MNQSTEHFDGRDRQVMGAGGDDEGGMPAENWQPGDSRGGCITGQPSEVAEPKGKVE